ncbi:ATP-binding protein [Paraglaciecola aquimarina]|uniref:histidine kinase n=1 Tax=Paraglaciecola aquimarina TaxID=1235557 RepID=A0ABU3SXD5_9ALTE|nr:ATP-binding protein [Paraglaciecola aquimarina]MDU0354667.1 ATP-binding protein [Paraglaciecola aquimarina]
MCRCTKNLATQRVAKNLALMFEYEKSLAETFNGDAHRIQQILMNLIGNAIKFTLKGFVRLSVSKRGSHIAISIEDSGIGISEERLEQIFDPFSQADATVTRRFGGTGLGTTISQQLAKLMGGKIEVQSTMGKGSIFTIILPLVEVQDDLSCLPLEVMKPATSVLSILVADDVKQNSDLLELRLGRLGHKVTSVSDGELAYLQVKQQYFDLVLMDLHMPGVDGLSATKLIRSWEKQHNRQPIAIIALTASVQEVDRLATVTAGMNGFASKPVELEQLLAEIERVTGTHTDNTTTPESEINRLQDQDLSIDWVSGSSRWGSREELAKQAVHFVDKMINELSDAANKTLPEQAALAHKTKGSAANLCLYRSVKLCEKLEELLDDVQNTADANLKQLNQHCAEIWCEVSLALTQVKLDVGIEMPNVGISSTSPTSATQASASLPLEQLEAILDSLSNGEINDTLLAPLYAALPADESEQVQSAIFDFEFEQAITLIVNSNLYNAHHLDD